MKKLTLAFLIFLFSTALFPKPFLHTQVEAGIRKNNCQGFGVFGMPKVFTILKSQVLSNIGSMNLHLGNLSIIKFLPEGQLSFSRQALADTSRKKENGKPPVHLQVGAGNKNNQITFNSEDQTESLSSDSLVFNAGK